MKLSIIAAVLFLLISTTVDAKQIRSRDIRRRAKAGKSCKKDKQDTSTGTLTATIWAYPGTQSGVKGDVRVVFDSNGSLTLDAALAGVENHCDKCGIHIHSGTSCETDAQVEGHYWNDNGFMDPWFAKDPFFAYYNSNNMGVGTAHFTLTNGFGFDCNAEHAVVVHAQNGDRVGCGVLNAGKSCKKLKATVTKYPEYNGGEEVTGEVEVDFDDNNDLTMTANLDGASLNCDNSGGTSKCGIHIHAGLTCDDKDLVGGHYWDKFAPVPDPWFASDPYYAVYDATGAVDFTVTNGYDCSNNVGHAVVVHKVDDGEKVGCGILKEA